MLAPIRLLAGFLCLAAIDASAEVIYVNKSVAGGAGDGSSWANAFTHLQDALAAARGGDEIWVARGVYYPDEGAGRPADSPGATFAPGTRVSLYGGFAGTESARSDRDAGRHLTILSGDVAQDDLNGDSNTIAESVSDLRGANARTVVTIGFQASGSILDGFVVTAGQAAVSGGGLLVSAREATIKWCRFSGNSAARYGGAIQIAGADVPIANCIVSGNVSETGGGGANFEDVVSSPTVTNCLFLGNTAPGGGAIRLDSSNPRFANCSIAGNLATASAGGVSILNSSPQFHSTIIWANQSAIAHEPLWHSFRVAGGSPSFSNCVVAGSGGQLPGGILPVSNRDADPRFLVPVTPGVIPEPLDLQLLPGSPGIDFGPGRSAVPDETDLNENGLTNEWTPLDLSGNPRVHGGNIDCGAYESGHGPAILNAPGPLVIRPGSLLIEGAFELGEIFGPSAASFSVYSGPTEDVLAAVRLDPATGRIDLHLDPGRLGRAGLVVSAADAAGQASYLSLLIDVFPPVFFVDADAPSGGDGLSWGTAFRHLQDALQFGGGGYEIWVAEGVYFPDEGVDQVDNDPASSFELPDRIPLYGGFAGQETERSSRAPDLNHTILSGDLAQDDSNADGNFIAETVGEQAGENAHNVLRATRPETAVSIDGFVVTAGNGGTTVHGGGLLVADADVSVTGCTFLGNTALRGGALGAAQRGSVTLTDCELRGNQAIAGGGAVHHTSTGAVTLLRCSLSGNSTSRGGAVLAETPGVFSARECAFIGNRSAGNGGAIYANSADLAFDECGFHDNLAARGGGTYLSSTTGAFRQCTFSHNGAESAFGSGGAVEASFCHGDFIGCTFVANTANSGGAMRNQNCEFRIVNCSYSNHTVAAAGGALQNWSSALSIVNSAFAGNTAQVGGAISNAGAEAVSVVNCAFTGNVATLRGGALLNGASSFPDPALPVRNSIFWNNVEAGMVDTPGATVCNSSSVPASFAHCLLPNSRGSAAWVEDFGTDLGSNLDADPQFVAPLDPVDAVFDLRLQAGSPAIDAGSDAALPSDEADLDRDGDRLESLPLDLSGGPRIRGVRTDIGPYETAPGPAIISPPASVPLLPRSGAHAGLLDVSQLFDATAVQFGISQLIPEGIVAATVDPVSGRLDLEVQPDRHGRTYLALTATDAAGNTSLLSVAVDVLPLGFRVDKRARGKATGLTWEDAFPTLQAGLAVKPVPGTPLELWVAAGRYFPDEGPGDTADDPASSFRLPSGTQVFGGFAGTEAQRDERDPERQPTILSGDLAQDDFDPDRDGIADSAGSLAGTNADHIVTGHGIGPDTILDGLVLTASADGALLLEDASLVVRGCRLTGNLGSLGGAVRITRGAPQFDDCLLTHNTASLGGAVYASLSSPRWSACRFVANSADRSLKSGGALWLGGSPSAEIVDCEFTGNVAVNDGGAIEANNSRLTIRSSAFDANRARGGGALLVNDCTTEIAHCLFAGNDAGNGGAIYGFVEAEFPFTCHHSRFLGNHAQATGGAVGFPLLPEAAASARFDNCLFAANRASVIDGGAIKSAAPLEIESCTFAGNAAGSDGGALSTGANSIVANSILWANSSAGSTTVPAASVKDSNEQVSFSHCLIANSGGSGNWDDAIGRDGGNNIDADPLFLVPIPPEESPSLGGVFVLASGSPAIGAGSSPPSAPPTDLSGRPRIIGEKIDLGAYEFQGEPLDSDGDGLSDMFELAHTTPPSSTALAPFDDLEHDGLVNLFESIHGLDPGLDDRRFGPVISTAVIDGQSYLTLTYRRSLSAIELLNLHTERSTDLGVLDTWSSGATTILRIVPIDSQTDLITERSNQPVTAQPAEYLRLRVTKKP